MIRDITLGQYYPADSVLHRLDPRTKLLCTLFFIISVFLAEGPWGYGIVTAFLLIMILSCKVPLKYMFKGMKAALYILIFTMLFNLFLVPGKVICSWWIFKITREGIIMAVKMAVRLTYLVVGSQVMTLTTTPNQLTDGLERLLRPLNRLHIQVYEIAMMMSIALRFIPILMDETDKIMKAQMARGADFESGNFIRRIRSYIPILIPLFVSAFRRANDLAMAMEARCYHGGEDRTSMKPLKYRKHDYIAYLSILLYLIIVIAVKFI